MPALRHDTLTQRERRFLENLRMGMEPKPATLAAGWANASHALETLKKREIVQKHIAQIYREARQKAEVTRDEVLEGFKHAINDAKLAGEPATQIKGWTEIGKMCGFYAPEKKEIRITDGARELEEKIQDLSTEELLRLAGQDSLEVIEGTYERID